MAIKDTRSQDIALETTRTSVLRNKRTWLLAAGAIALLALIGWTASSWLSGARSVDEKRLRIATVTRGDLVRDVAAEGRVIAANSPSLYAIGSGIVTLHVVAGDTVKQGDVIAEIDSPELRSLLAQEQATLASLDAQVSRAALDAQLNRSATLKAIDQARVEQVAAERQLQRYSRGFEGGAVAKVDVDKAADDVAKTRIGIDHARQDASLQSASMQFDARNRKAIADRQRAVVGELQRQVNSLRIVAPFDGQVGQVFVSQRQNVQSNAAIASLVDLKQFEVEIKVPESQARELSVGLPAQLTGNNVTSNGQISAISPEVVNGEVSVRVRFEPGQQPAELRQNQRLSARVVLGSRQNILKVERGPSLDMQSSGAWVIRDGTATRIPVELGVGSVEEIEIKRGLKQGDSVIVSGAEDFKPDDRVRVN